MGKAKRYRASVVTQVLGDLNRESAAKATYVVGYLTMASQVEPQKIIDTVKERLMDIPRFRSRYDGKAGAFVELEIDEMDFGYHFQTRYDGETPSYDDVTASFAGDMTNVYLDKTKPLWRITIIPKLDDGRSLIITNISHVLGDGVSQVEVLYRILDEDALQSKITSRPKDKREKQKVGTFRKTMIFIGGVFEGVFAVFGRPDPGNSLKLKDTSKVSTEKRQAFTEKIPLEKCRDIKNKIQGATLNDVFMVLLTMVLKRYFEENNEKPRKISAAFPVNLRRSTKDNFDKYGSPHNVWAYGHMNFNLKYKNEIDLFRKLKKTLDKVKLSPSPIVQQKIGALIRPLMTLKARNKIVLNLGNKSTAQLSNVPGPSAQVTIAGYDVDDLNFQLYSPLGLYVGLITYNGTLSCSINSDSSIADPALLAKHWLPAFDQLYDVITKHEGMITL